MVNYQIPICPPKCASGQAAPKAALLYSWFGGEKAPRTSFSITYSADFGFHVEMESEEIPQSCRYTHDDEPVYKDSCMEIFLDFFPERHLGYVNMEINAAGAMLCMFGRSRENRKYTAELSAHRPSVSTVVSDTGWRAHLEIPLAFVEDLYGSSSFCPGHILLGNVYKCGDDTAHPHWGSWHWLGETPVDFHQPETFGTFILGNAPETTVQITER